VKEKFNKTQNRMKTTLTLIIGLTLAASALDTYAQAGPPGRGRGPGGPPGGAGSLPPPLAAVLDLNQDGVLSAEEIAAAPALLKALDKNNDGVLTAGEFCPADRNPQGRGPGRGAGACRWIDTDGDGVLSTAEMTNAADSLRKLDLNGDGAVSADELRPGGGFGRGQGAGQGGGRRGPGGPPAR
jgi:hypothetical protein